MADLSYCGHFQESAAHCDYFKMTKPAYPTDTTLKLGRVTYPTVTALKTQHLTLTIQKRDELVIPSDHIKARSKEGITYTTVATHKTRDNYPTVTTIKDQFPTVTI